MWEVFVSQSSELFFLEEVYACMVFSLGRKDAVPSHTRAPLPYISSMDTHNLRCIWDEAEKLHSFLAIVLELMLLV